MHAWSGFTHHSKKLFAPLATLLTLVQDPLQKAMSSYDVKPWEVWNWSLSDRRDTLCDLSCVVETTLVLLVGESRAAELWYGRRRIDDEFGAVTEDVVQLPSIR